MSSILNTVRNDIKNWWWFLVIGLLSVAAGAAGIVAASGSAFIVNGIFNMVLAFQLKNLKGQIEKPEREGRVRVKGEGQQYAQ